jgi:hypothetical protein
MVSAPRAGKSGQKTVKAFEGDITLINDQAKKLGCTAAEIIHEMCEALRRQTYLEELGESFDLAVADTKGFVAFKNEHNAWDIAIEDGLEDAS